jgi:hypothetical protein
MVHHHPYPPSKKLSRRRRHSPPKLRTAQRHIQVRKRIHDGLEPQLVQVLKEVLDAFLDGGGGRIESGERSVCARRSRTERRRRLRGAVRLCVRRLRRLRARRVWGGEQQEFDVGAGDEG